MENIQSEKQKDIHEFSTSDKFLRLEKLKPSEKFCGKLTELYPTRYLELFVNIIDGGFNLE